MQLTAEQKSEMRRVFPGGFCEEDIPAFWRNEKPKKSECCGARMIGGVQCETCGSDGEVEEEEKPEEESDLEKPEDDDFAEMHAYQDSDGEWII